jgi:hypothetical protein
MGAVVCGGVTRGAKDMLSAGWHTVDGLTPLEAGMRGWEGHHALAGVGDPQLTQAELQGRALHPHLCASPSNLVCRPLQRRAA